MEYRQLGSSELQVSTVGLGCWAIGGWWWGGTDVDRSVAAIRHAVDIGINFIDTAPAYGWGLAEEILGKALEGGRREKAVVATKCGLVWDRECGEFYFESEGHKVYRCLRKEGIFREIESSLRRLRTDYIDIYQCHWPDPTTPLTETMEALAALYEQGKIRAIGVSNFTLEMHRECQRLGPLHSSQPRYNMLDRRIERDVLPFCRDNNIAVLAYSPLEQGILTGKVTLDRAFDHGDYRQGQPWFQERNLRRVLEALDDVRLIGESYGKTLAQLAIAWLLAQPGVTSAIVGARSPEQVDENARGAGWSLDPEDLERVDADMLALGEPHR
jgi:aryl-alcohol dehydrogenase-like predicted oxidoreductase